MPGSTIEKNTHHTSSSSDSEVFDYEPRNLDWSNKDFDKKPWQETVQSLALVAEDILSLDMSHNYLGNLAYGGFGEICEAIPRQIKFLNFSSNSLIFKSSERIIEGFEKLPELDVFYLKNNGLHQLSGDSLTKLLASVPYSTNILDLSNNELGAMKGNNLAKGLNGIHPNVVSVNLTDNQLGRQSVKQLKEMIVALPPSVKTLDLTNNNLNDEQVKALIPTIRRSNLCNIKLADNPVKDSGLAITLKTVLKANQLKTSPPKVSSENKALEKGDGTKSLKKSDSSKQSSQAEQTQEETKAKQSSGFRFRKFRLFNSADRKPRASRSAPEPVASDSCNL